MYQSDSEWATPECGRPPGGAVPTCNHLHDLSVVPSLNPSAALSLGLPALWAPFTTPQGPNTQSHRCPANLLNNRYGQRTPADPGNTKRKGSLLVAATEEVRVVTCISHSGPWKPGGGPGCGSGNDCGGAGVCLGTGTGTTFVVLWT